MNQIIDELSNVRFSDSDELDPESFFVRFKTYYDENPRHKYSEISKVVYKFNDDRIDILRINLATIKAVAEKYEENKLVDKIDKLIDHADLSENQRKLIEDVSKETRIMMQGYQKVLTRTYQELMDTKQETETAKRELEQTKEQIIITKNELEVTKNNYKDAEVEIEKLQQDKTSIYTQFVVILGIFTAIVLGAFGSLELIGSVFTNINEVPTGKLLVFTSLTSLGILIMLFLLMQWINKIVYRNHPNKQWNYTYKENLVFYIGIIVLIYMLFIGALLYGEEPKNSISSWLTNNIFGIGSLILITIALIITIIYSFTLLAKQSDQKSKP